MNHHTHCSSCGLQHLLPVLTKDRIANTNHESIGRRRSFRAWQGLDVPGQTQRTKHGDAGHEIIGGTAVIEEPNHDITLRSDGISNRAAMAARSKDQPTVWHQP
jgi:hypothetical protein